MMMMTMNDDDDDDDETKVNKKPFIEAINDCVQSFG
jgi:hypothetical protein